MSRVAVVVAAIEARATVSQSVARFREEVAGRGEVIVVDASRDGTAEEVGRRFGEVRILRRTPGRLVPELWAEGLREADAPLVAFSTAQMAPRAGWLDGLLGGLEGRAAAGGPIAAGPGLAAIDRAVYLLRYAGYWPPLPPRPEIEPPGENALYRRDRLLEVRGSWAAGFWEVEVHRRLRARGDRLGMAPGAVVEFLGGTAAMAMVGQRFAHARRYGAGRAGGRGLARRLARSAAAPAVPALLALRVARALRGRGEPLGPWIAAAPGFALLATAWAAGEAVGFGWPGRIDAA